MPVKVSENDKKLAVYDLFKVANDLHKIEVTILDSAELIEKFPRYYINTQSVLDDASIELEDVRDRFFNIIMRMK